MLSPKDNYLETITFGHPDHVPLGNENVFHGFQFEGNFKCETWTDSWGVHWEVGLEGTVPFPKGNPLPNLDGLGDYQFPDPDDLEFTPEMRTALESVDR